MKTTREPNLHEIGEIENIVAGMPEEEQRRFWDKVYEEMGIGSNFDPAKTIFNVYQEKYVTGENQSP